MDQSRSSSSRSSPMDFVPAMSSQTRRTIWRMCCIFAGDGGLLCFSMYAASIAPLPFYPELKFNFFRPCSYVACKSFSLTLFTWSTRLSLVQTAGTHRSSCHLHRLSARRRAGQRLCLVGCICLPITDRNLWSGRIGGYGLGTACCWTSCGGRL